MDGGATTHAEPAAREPATAQVRETALGNRALGNRALGNPALGNPALGNPALGNRALSDRARRGDSLADLPGAPLDNLTASKLPAALAKRFGDALGQYLATARIHPQVSGLGARAATRGLDIAFVPGAYQPETPEGQQLAADGWPCSSSIAERAADPVRRRRDPGRSRRLRDQRLHDRGGAERARHVLHQITDGVDGDGANVWPAVHTLDAARLYPDEEMQFVTPTPWLKPVTLRQLEQLTGAR